MIIFIQSKSGDFNASLQLESSEGSVNSLAEAMKVLRKIGSYPTLYKSERVLVPFEEISYIKEDRNKDLVAITRTEFKA